MSIKHREKRKREKSLYSSDDVCCCNVCSVVWRCSGVYSQLSESLTKNVFVCLAGEPAGPSVPEVTVHCNLMCVCVCE